MVWIPILHYVEFADKGYYGKGVLNENINITSGRVIKDQYGRYFVSIIIDYEPDYNEIHQYKTEGLGIDLGIKSYATIYDGSFDKVFKVSHPWKGNTNLRFYQSRIDALMRVIANKVEINKRKGGIPATIYHSHNIQKLWDKVRKYYRKIHDYMDNFIKKLCNKLVVKAKPMWIAIENLDVSEMLQNKSTNHKFHDIIQKSNWYKFREVLNAMASSNGCEIYEANKYYPSSKKCHVCGYKNDISLKDRTITCARCGETYDRDENAAMNLYNKYNGILDIELL